MPHVLVIEDEPILAKNICDSLALTGLETARAGSGEEGLEAAEKNPPDVILLDLRLPGIDGMEVLQTLKKRGHSASVIIMTAHGNVRTAVTAMKAGASDFLTKPLDLDELQLVVERVIQHRRVTAELKYFRNRQQAGTAGDEIIGSSKPIQSAKRFVEKLVSTQALSSEIPPSVLITGETGTGKDLFARAIHYGGPRSDRPFVQINCTALPENLVEAELFGYVKGAFTDARGDKRGLMESAEGGTVFLDEIGHMPLALQTKLLSTIERRTIRPVGGTTEKKINIHICAATNRDLVKAVEGGEFREDLYHRLRVLTLHLAPLRERREDIPLLAGHFLGLYTARFNLPAREFSDRALQRLCEHHWPGNVRELSHQVESAVLTVGGSVIEPEDLSIQTSAKPGGLRIEGASDRTIEIDFAEGSPKLDRIEYEIIKAALEYARYNVSQAARILGISRDAVRYRMEKYEKEHPSEG